MPSTMTHAAMARDIYNRLSKKVQEKFDNQLEEYVTYSQGPDLFYFYGIILPFRKYLRIQKFGGRVHREKVNELFIYLTNEVKKNKNINQFVFLCGLLTHYMGDTTCHPLVNYIDDYINKSLKRRKDYHFMVELYMDNYILLKKGYDYKKFKCHKYAFNTKKNNDIEKLLNNAFYDVFKEKNIGTIYYKSLRDMKVFFHILRYDPYKIKRYIFNILYLFAFYLKRDFRYLSYNFNLTEDNNNLYLNLNHKTWYNVKKKDNISNKSFMDLYNETIDKSVDKITKLYDYIFNNKKLDLESFYGNLSYANGLPLKK